MRTTPFLPLENDMTELTHKNGVPQYTLEHFEKDFADRHLLHGVIAKWAKEKPDSLAIINADTKKQVTYAELDRVLAAIAAGDTAAIEAATLDKVQRMVATSAHKREMVPLFRLT